MIKKLTQKTNSLTGQHQSLRGDCSGLSGDCSGLSGNLDECGITYGDRAEGIYIRKLVADISGD